MGGGSLLAFAERYPDACIVGVDVSNHNLHEQVKAPHVNFILGDAYNTGTVPKVLEISKSFDIIVDDCIHNKYHQFDAFELWNPLLSPGGLYIIEDVFEHEALDLLSRLSKYNREWQIYFGDTRHLQLMSNRIYPDIILGLKRYE